MGLELLAVAFALLTFADKLRGGGLVVWSYSTGAEAGARKGSAKRFGHSCIVHTIRTKAVQLHAELRVERVPY